jgi:hypothetical protein
MANLTAAGIIWHVFDDDHCGHMVNYFLTMFGACRYDVNSNSSTMVLKDVNATFAPQTVPLGNPDQPLVGFIEGDCTSPDNCTDPSGAPLVYSHTFYNTTQCTQPTYATGYWNFTMGTCYGLGPGVSVRFDCSDDYVFTTFFSGNCKGPILQIEARSTHDCIFEDPNNKKRDFFGGSKLSRDLALYAPFSTAYKCGTINIHPAPPSPPPTSAASPLVVSLIPLVLLPLLFLA